MKLGFVKEEKMSKYYLNGGDAYRLKLWIDKGLPSTAADGSNTTVTDTVAPPVIAEETNANIAVSS